MIETRLLCLPHAGAGWIAFHSWLAVAPPELEVLPVPMAGRDRRIFEKPHSDLHQAVRAISGDVSSTLADEIPVVLFGHCLGGLLAYELARCLLRDGVPVVQLMISGVAGPGYVRPQRITGLPDEEFLERVIEVGGYRNAALDDREMRGLLLPALRADVQMQEDYRPQDCDPLDVPVMALRGEADETVSTEDIGQWREVTKAGFTVVELPGGHMYFLDQGPALLDFALAASQPRPVAQGGSQ